MMNSVSFQIQRAISDAINNQLLPQIQNVIMAGSGQETRRGWERSDERPESYSEVQYNAKAKITLNREHGDKTHRNVHDIHRGFSFNFLEFCDRVDVKKIPKGPRFNFFGIVSLFSRKDPQFINTLTF